MNLEGKICSDLITKHSLRTVRDEPKFSFRIHMNLEGKIHLNLVTERTIRIVREESESSEALR